LDERMTSPLKLESKVVNYIWHLSPDSTLHKHGDLSLDD